MDNKGVAFFQKIKAKGFYFSTALAFAVVIASVVISYYTSGRIGDKIESTTEPETVFSVPAEAEKEDVPDERITLGDDEENDYSFDDETQSPASTESETQTTTAVTTTEAALVNKEYIRPVDGEIIKPFSFETQQYSKTMGDWRVHLGVDISGEEGDAVSSVGNGKVSKVISDTKWGYIIEIDYGTFTARYCGISQDGAVGIDQKVTTGEIIGTLCAIPCEALDGVHLHLEIIKDSVNIDPVKAISAF